jgi:uncharacterized membrane protein
MLMQLMLLRCHCAWVVLNILLLVLRQQVLPCICSAIHTLLVQAWRMYILLLVVLVVRWVLMMVTSPALRRQLSWSTPACLLSSRSYIGCGCELRATGTTFPFSYMIAACQNVLPACGVARQADRVQTFA